MANMGVIRIRIDFIYLPDQQWIRIRRIRIPYVFGSGLVRGIDPDSSIIKQKFKNSKKKTLIPTDL
jgi:hypothetical protein